jgi:hypothetical protein
MPAKMCDLPKGVRSNGRGYRAQYREKYLGTFPTPEEAGASYAAAFEADPIVYLPAPKYLVDDDVRDEVARRKWVASKKGYPQSWTGCGSEYMHRLVWRLCGGVEPQPGQEIDHINRDPSDNRRSNLRLMTHRGNNLNNASSCVYERRAGSWEVRISSRSPDRFHKTYDDEETARLVAKHVKKKLIEREVIATLEEVR